MSRALIFRCCGVLLVATGFLVAIHFYRQVYQHQSVAHTVAASPATANPIIISTTLPYGVSSVVSTVLTTPIPQPPTPKPTPTPTPTPTPVPTPASVIKNQAQVVGHILMYHYIRTGVDEATDGLGYRLSIAPDVLDQQLSVMQADGYHFITMADLAAGKGDSKAVALTFDDGYADAYTAAYPILKKHQATATFYVISGKIGDRYMSWDQIRELHNNGFEIGAHTINHLDLAKLSPDAARHEIVQSKKDIEAQIGAPVVSFCYPSGQFTPQTVELVRQAGFTNATTTQPGVAHDSNNRFTLPRLRIAPTLTLHDLERELASSYL